MTRRWRAPTPSWPLLLGALLLALGCGRPIDRPLEGAPPVDARASRSLDIEPPPTLTPPQLAQAVPSPIVIALPSPSPSPTAAAGWRIPVMSRLLPIPNTSVPAGNVEIGARVSGSTDLAEVTLLVDGAPVQPEIAAQSPLVWLVSYTGRLSPGRHEVRISARDREGRIGGYRWSFEVEAPAQASPTARPR